MMYFKKSEQVHEHAQVLMSVRSTIQFVVYRDGCEKAQCHTPSQTMVLREKLFDGVCYMFDLRRLYFWIYWDG